MEWSWTFASGVEEFGSMGESLELFLKPYSRKKSALKK
jgi:hypothetical protein